MQINMCIYIFHAIERELSDGSIPVVSWNKSLSVPLRIQPSLSQETRIDGSRSLTRDRTRRARVHNQVMKLYHLLPQMESKR